jgi:hypothetical protein
MLDHIGQVIDQHQDDLRRPSLRHERCDVVGCLGRRFLAGFGEVLTCWLGPSLWRGKPICRASFSDWSTSLDDVEQSARAILRIDSENGLNSAPTGNT